MKSIHYYVEFETNLGGNSNRKATKYKPLLCDLKSKYHNTKDVEYQRYTRLGTEFFKLLYYLLCICIVVVLMFSHCYFNIVSKFSDFVQFIIRHYASSLQYGCKYIYQSMPTLLTLWLDFGVNAYNIEQGKQF